MQADKMTPEFRLGHRHCPIAAPTSFTAVVVLFRSVHLFHPAEGLSVASNDFELIKEVDVGD